MERGDNKMAVTPKEYGKMVDKATPPSKAYASIPAAFLCGGGICVLGQLLLTRYESLGLIYKDASTMVSVTLVFLTALLTGAGVFDKIAKFAGAGTFVPITGFANAMVSPALEFRSEGWILGLGAKLFSIAGAVIVYGTSASVIYGIIYWILTMF